MLKNLKRQTKIFFYGIALRKLLRGITVETFIRNVESLKDFEDSSKVHSIQQKLFDKKMISTEELEFLVEYQRKKQWEKG